MRSLADPQLVELILNSGIWPRLRAACLDVVLGVGYPNRVVGKTVNGHPSVGGDSLNVTQVVVRDEVAGVQADVGVLVGDQA